MARENMGKLWTAEERDQLKQEINNGAGLAEMCETHGRTPYGILNTLMQMNVIVQVGMHYHRVDPDPWELYATVRTLQYGDKK